ncbi:MAG: DUF58 domain-containing protein [Alphaproteobacteria bacterium]|nr:DUF58 domain-containing protein [Alphaproteobacteria bacterium]
MAFHRLKSFLDSKKAPELSEALAPSFKTLMKMKGDVPYLKDFNYKKTALQSGDSKSAFKGRGIEFEEVRSYQFGDDVRDIDWRVTARKNQPFTKVYVEEKDREVYVWLDLSQKMYFGTKGALKSVTAAKTAALIGWLSLSYKDRFGLALYTGAQTYLFDAERGQEHFLSVLKKIENVCKDNLSSVKDTQSVQKSLQLLQKKATRNAVVFLVGSFSDIMPNDLNQVLNLMQTGEVYMADIYDSLEAFAPPSGAYPAAFEGEFALIENYDTKYELTYEAYFENKRRLLKDFCLRYGAHYRPIRSDLPIYQQLRPI